jgi:hypothetical protein
MNKLEELTELTKIVNKIEEKIELLRKIEIEKLVYESELVDKEVLKGDL